MYRYKVRAFNIVDGQRIEGAYSSELTTCTLPANVSFSLCSTDVDSITLNWNKVSKATGYQVEMYTNGTWKTLSTLRERATLQAIFHRKQLIVSE